MTRPAAYRTDAELQEAKAALVATMPGFELPAAYAIGIHEDSAYEFGYVNHRGVHNMPAVVLASVIGYRSGSATYDLDLDTLKRSIDLLKPAESCLDYSHPNLWAWENLRDDLVNGRRSSDATVIAVFIGDESDSPTTAAHGALLTKLSLA